jgi:hypothetical protein
MRNKGIRVRVRVRDGLKVRVRVTGYKGIEDNNI